MFAEVKEVGAGGKGVESSVLTPSGTTNQSLIGVLPFLLALIVVVINALPPDKLQPSLHSASHFFPACSHSVNMI